ncbi:hypothetical protein [Microlunatus antarcticus]|uniref:Pyruvate/2-oxoglutarate dehydrogenase complex dihydrolipoamide acyltransferase (E2) component n=1 Tax=Microlunatus antarcticus TaxID=53388 RepID=A0A7W5JX89_9ACTN|nr:hypothetical protein [Microlunatus antarcticus]MBB3327407.1 pyruvate/2-oxoglutarate dehydrogenase complex dihydrolipoamide acyltransferase (E2) component [Microlunatus antarcticus]
MRARVVAAALGTVLALAGCSGGPAPAAPSASSVPSAESAPSSTVAPTAATTPSPSALATLPAAQCLTGRYALVRFVAVGQGSTYGTGQGGDVTLTFEGDGYTLAGAGREPVVVTLAGQTGNLTVDGESQGGYALDDAVATFTPTSATGGGSLDDGTGGDGTRLTMKQVDGVIGLSGQGQVACTDRFLTITLASIRLELART